MIDHTFAVPKYEGDVSNVKAVAVQHAGTEDERICLLAPSSVPMTKTEALVFAAWLVVLADQSENFEEFRRVLRAVLET